MAKSNTSRYWASCGPLKSLEVLSDKYFLQEIEGRLLQNLLKCKDYHWFQQASDQAQCEWVSENVYIAFCRQNTSFSAQDLSQLDVWQPWTGSHVTAFTVLSPSWNPCWKTENINLCSAECSVQGCVAWMHICSELKQNDLCLPAKDHVEKCPERGRASQLWCEHSLTLLDPGKLRKTDRWALSYQYFSSVFLRWKEKR